MKKLLFFCVLLSLLLFVGGSGYFAYLVFVAPGEHLDLRKIQQSVLTESTVYYRDGRTKIGAMYSEARRDYLVVPNQMTASTHPDNMVPPLFLKAIIASEDRNFYDHIGVSVMGILRAAVANFKAGRVVQGGSTLTQQTAELLFEHKAKDRWGKWREKALETLDAFRLEAQYSKDQILEFYSNLFHVHGTGQGLAIAARYYFNKKVIELDLAEIAFIAGSVKGPANYNPFRTSDPNRKKSIIQKATERRNYVLGNMLLDGAISEEDFQEATQEPVQFRKGNFRFEANHLMDVVLQLLETEPLKSKLQEAGITDLKQAEASIYTTLDPSLQHVGEFALKQHLSDLEFRIKDYTLPQELPLSEKTTPQAKEFYVGTILQKAQKPKPHVLVQVGTDEGTVAGEELEHFVSQVLRLKKKKKLKAADYQKAFQHLQPGEPVLVSTHQKTPEGQWVLAIEQTPSLNGGVFIMQEGSVRGIVGGYQNHGFNRALQAKRQPGSTFKLPVYLAALQLGWSPLDPLPNERRVYSYQGDFYFPRPDHPPQDEVASMVWAGAKSENLATVYLLVHLLDQLDLDQFTELMRFNGLLKQPKESNRQYRRRLRKVLGVTDTQEHLMPAIFATVQNRLNNDFLTHASLEEKQMWERLFYDASWQMAYENHKKAQVKTEEQIEALAQVPEEKEQNPEKLEQEAAREKAEKQREKLMGEQKSLKHNFLRFENLAATALEKIAVLESLFKAEDATALQELDPLLLEGFFIQPQQAGSPDVPPVAYTFVIPPEEENAEDLPQEEEEIPEETAADEDALEEWEPLTAEDFLQSDSDLAESWQPLTPEMLVRYHALWNETTRRGLFQTNNVWIEGKTRLSILATARDMLQQRLEEMKPLKPYTPERLYYHRDFRIALALQTVIKLSQTLGIRSVLRPVLSFPLGANEIALDELALMYHTLMTGQLLIDPEHPHQNSWKLIDRIENSRGDVIYQSEQIREQIIPQETVQALREILRSVVEYGTGRNSKAALTLRGSKAIGLRVPAYGKTGTANNYSNATYAGFLPTIQGGQTSVSGGYTITTYVGLDRQESAQPLPFKLTGSSGGLPVWAEVARYIIHTSAYRNKLDWTQLPKRKRYVLPPPDAEEHTQKVSLVTGLAVSQEQSSEGQTAVVHLPPVPSKHSRKALLFEKPLEMN